MTHLWERPNRGYFVWRPERPQPVLLVAGGSGVVPLMSMVRTRTATGSTTPMRLLYSVRSPVDVLYADELAAVRSHHGGGNAAGVDVTLVYTRRTRPAGRRDRVGWTRRRWPGRLGPGAQPDLLRLRSDGVRRGDGGPAGGRGIPVVPDTHRAVRVRRRP